MQDNAKDILSTPATYRRLEEADECIKEHWFDFGHLSVGM